MIQITNANVEQVFSLKLDGYSATLVTEVNVIFTNQLTGLENTLGSSTVQTNGRYQEITIKPPAAPLQMVEGLYMVTIKNRYNTVTYATRLAFVSSVPAFKEASFTAYEEQDQTAYNVYVK